MSGGTERPGQTYLGTKVSKALFDAVERASAGGKSDFVRQAVAEKLKAAGYAIPEEWIKAPSRKGKGGPKRKRRSQTQSQTTGPKKLHVSDVLPIVNHPPDLIPSPKFLAEKLARTKKHK